MSVEFDLPNDAGGSPTDSSKDDLAEKPPHGGPTLPGVDIPDEKLSECEATIRYAFADRNILTHSLTHSSIAPTRGQSNERLEFLGDAIMGAAICEYLFETYPEYSEGELTRIKSAVVSRQTCATMSVQLRFDRFLLLGKGLATHDRIPSSVLAAVFESIIAAIYLDGGWLAAKKFVLYTLSEEVARVAKSTHGQNYKSQLQQIVQKNFGETPAYKMLDEKGPDHAKCFQIAAAIGSQVFPAAWGPSKKEAEQNAAQNALEAIDEVVDKV
ncbi:MAG: ribonuclease III [Planctomycetota bacterium]|nr:ribonuclease III [Planctomycetota bacterium]MDA1163754.1 ribonuclease III [Planctomycetota bacterium]